MTSTIPEMDRHELRRFGLLTGTVLALLFGLLLPWVFDRPYPGWPWVAGGILSLWAIIHPASLGPPYRLWMRAGHVLGWINTRLVLGVLFYVLVLPIGLVMRAFGKDPMRRTRDRQARSYRVSSTPRSPDHMERPF